MGSRVKNRWLSLGGADYSLRGAHPPDQRLHHGPDCSPALRPAVRPRQCRVTSCQRATPNPAGTRSAPGTSPSPRTSAPAPGDRAGCPTRTAPEQPLAQPRPQAQGRPHPPAGLWTHTPGPGTCPGRRNLLQSLPTGPAAPMKPPPPGRRPTAVPCPISLRRKQRWHLRAHCNARPPCTDKGRPFHRLMTHTSLL